jgi:hypothetical protein
MRAAYFVLLIAFSAPAIAIAADQKLEERTTRTKKARKKTRAAEKQAEKSRSKKAIAAHSKKIESSKKAAQAEEAKLEPPLKGDYVDPESAAWTDPLALRDSLFLSTAARHARGQGPP